MPLGAALIASSLPDATGRRARAVLVLCLFSRSHAVSPDIGLNLPADPSFRTSVCLSRYMRTTDERKRRGRGRARAAAAGRFLFSYLPCGCGRAWRMRQMCDGEQHPTRERSLYKYDILTSCLAISPTLHSKEYSHTSLTPPPRRAVTTVRAVSAICCGLHYTYHGSCVSSGQE